MIKIYLMVEINNKKSATDRYLNYIYNDKNLLDGRNIAETLIGRKGNNKKVKFLKHILLKIYLKILLMQYLGSVIQNQKVMKICHH